MAEEAERRRGEAGGEQRKRKKTLGRQKIEIKRIERGAARHVCFSKRRSGLFKKAAELAVLCGAHVAVVVFSGAEKPYSLGHPSVDAVVDRYLDPASAPAPGGQVVDQAVLEEFEREKERLDKAIAAEARRREALDAAARAAGVPDSDDVGRAGMPDLLATLAALERVQAEATQRMHEAIVEEAMMQHCAAAVSGDASGAFYCAAGAGAFAADGGASSRQGVMDAQMLMGGDANHASMPFAPMTMPPYLPPPPFNYVSHHNQLAGYGYDIGDGCHDAAAAAAYGKEGYHGTTTACNFFW
ncbi:hypothetical protein GQ55_4G109300 [Panicum hallii var. hallii]|uniref:MADS-box domain-containing protein n=1 Tax=Panicum hallii var. hallii TaxID=1504633 RepID=A0A2T7DXF8_9POAL|nr:hypothetical protein GQ55_4G109300 [Panicum hallii var. hallii]